MKTETVINYLGVELTIIGNYTQGENAIWYNNNMEGQPATSSEFEITHILTESGDNILGIFYETMLEDIIELVLINLEN